MRLFPALIAETIQNAGCHASVADNVYNALCALPDAQCAVLWLRLQGDSYSEIGATLEMSKGTAWKIIHGPIKDTVYSIIERSTGMLLNVQ